MTLIIAVETRVGYNGVALLAIVRRNIEKEPGLGLFFSHFSFVSKKSKTT